MLVIITAPHAHTHHSLSQLYTLPQASMFISQEQLCNSTAQVAQVTAKEK